MNRLLKNISPGMQTTPCFHLASLTPCITGDCLMRRKSTSITSLQKTGKTALFAEDAWLHIPPKPQLLPPEVSREDAATHGALDPPDGIQRPTHELHKE
jgi:hypothetical protein